jgi:hypothetical protein
MVWQGAAATAGLVLLGRGGAGASVASGGERQTPKKPAVCANGVTGLLACTKGVGD